MGDVLSFIQIFSIADMFALSWFVVCWIGYTLFARTRGSNVPTIPSTLSRLRGCWLEKLIERDIRIADMAALSALQRNVTFFASSTILILAGLLTVLGSTTEAIELAKDLPFFETVSRELWELKLLLLIWIFIYAFFKYSWSVRQYNFAIVLISGAPNPDDSIEEKQRFIEHANKLLNTANNSFNYGLRAYSFALAALGWFVQPWLLVITSTWVVAILYRREFHSRSLSAMSKAIK